MTEVKYTPIELFSYDEEHISPWMMVIVRGDVDMFKKVCSAQILAHVTKDKYKPRELILTSDTDDTAQPGLGKTDILGFLNAKDKLLIKINHVPHYFSLDSVRPYEKKVVWQETHGNLKFRVSCTRMELGGSLWQWVMGFEISG